METRRYDPRPRNTLPPLRAEDLDSDPLEQLRRWLLEAVDRGNINPHAMALATTAPDGVPSVRFVLLRGIHPDGLVFFTHYRSRKGRELDANPRAALAFYWSVCGRQARVEGDAERLGTHESDAYFAARPVGSRLGAIVSPQSDVLPEDSDLHREALALAQRLRRERAPLRRPEHWGGYRVRPTAFEFWQAGRNRIHDRFRYRRDGDAWRIERLAP